MKKFYLYLIVGVVVVGTAGYFLFFNSDSQDIKYRTEKVTRGDVTIQVRATGTINPVRTVQVGSQVTGIIEKIYIDFNDEVKQGQIIARIDSTFLYAAVKEAEANFERNQAQVNEAQRTYSRTTELFKKNLVSQADLDAAETAYESAIAGLKQTQGSLDRAKINLRYAIIRSPIDGVVISRDVDVGQTVTSGFQTPKLFSIANDLKRMQVEASVDEADIGQIKIGQAVSFTVDAYPDEQFNGNVSQVRLSPITVQNVVTYTVIIDVPNPELKLRPGMTATVSILVDKREGVLRVPTLAIRFQPPQEILDKMQNLKPNTSGDKQNISERVVQKDTMQPDNKHGKDESNQMHQGMAKRYEGQQDRNIGGMQFREGANHAQGMEDVAQKMAFKRKIAQIWILDNTKNLKIINVQTGLNDSRFVEITTDQLKEGDEVIVGMMNGSTSMAQQQSNPFGPQRMMMGGGGGMGRR